MGKNYFLASLKSLKKSDPELDPDPNPLVKSTDPHQFKDLQHCFLLGLSLPGRRVGRAVDEPSRGGSGACSPSGMLRGSGRTATPAPCAASRAATAHAVPSYRVLHSACIARDCLMS
jgi:hypothetical protein